MKILPKGQDTVEAVREWIKHEIVTSTTRIFNTGKFNFGISTGTIGILVAIEKLSGNPSIDIYLKSSILLLLLSILIALNIARPRIWKLSGDIDIYETYNKVTRYSIYNILLWFILWFVGLIIGIYAVFN